MKSFHVHTNGYLLTAVRVGGKPHKLYAHRLVAEAFVKGWFPGAVVDHIDGNKLNNRADNLEWVTHSENTTRMIRAGRNRYGARHHWAKLTDEQVAEIKGLVAGGMGCRETGARFGVSDETVRRIVKGETWNKKIAA